MRYILNICVSIRYTMLCFSFSNPFYIGIETADILARQHMTQCQGQKNIESNDMWLLSLPLPKVSFRIYARFVTEKVYHKYEKKLPSATRVGSQ